MWSEESRVPCCTHNVHQVGDDVLDTLVHSVLTSLQQDLRIIRGLVGLVHSRKSYNNPKSHQTREMTDTQPVRDKKVREVISIEMFLTFDFSGSGLLIQSLDISFLTNLDGRVHKALHELQTSSLVEFPGSLTILQNTIHIITVLTFS